ncbi:DNA replication and repair protein recF [Providencia stuartii]|nr:DNA replication and repair protein recF [Providencia stuartii]
MQLITPEGFTLLNGGPKYRRAFIDWGCFHNEPLFFSVWSDLKRLLKQRNAALRQVSRYEQIRHWDQQLAPLAEQISQWRSEYIAGIAENIEQTCQQFLPEFVLSVSFQRGWDKEIDYSELLERQFERDKMLTYTASGPHKADLRIRANGTPVEDMLSRGQLKLLMCALRLAQGEFFTQQSGQRCLYLLDDFASELDSGRRQLLAARLKATQAQVFVSAITPEQVKDMIDVNSKMFSVEHGKIEVKPQE